MESLLTNEMVLGLAAAAIIPLAFALLLSGPLRAIIRGTAGAVPRVRGRRRRLSPGYSPPRWTSSNDRG